jgi:hypothetical protein
MVVKAWSIWGLGAIGVAIVALLAVIAFALLSDDGGTSVDSVPISKTATPGPSPTATAAPRVTDPEDFGEFADFVAGAAAEQDTAFFAGRVRGTTYTCSEADVYGEGIYDRKSVCQEVGQQLEVVMQCTWASECGLNQPEALVTAIESYFASALPEENDEYGTGAVRLYAIGVTQWTDPERAYKAAILTAITGRREGGASKGARTVRAIFFQYVEGRWVIRGMERADVLAEELLSPDTAPFADWERY